MLEQSNRLFYLSYATCAAIAFSVPVTFYLVQSTFVQSWLLYLGNFLFLIVIVVFIFSFNKKTGKTASSIAMLTAGSKVTAAGVTFSLVLCFLLMLMLVPGLFHSNPGKVLKSAPVNTISGNTNGLVFKVVASAIVGNVVTGLFASSIFSFSLKGAQENTNS